MLNELKEHFRRVSEAALPSVVGLSTTRAGGSGFVVAPGLVVTNAHNLGGGDVTLVLQDGRTAAAEPAGIDVDGDLAVLRADIGDASPVNWSDRSAQVGDPVFALANPGGRGPRVTFGVVSSTQRSFRGPRGRRIRGSLEHTAPLLPGSSGGPITDEDGNVLGINTHRLGEGFYLSIPADASLRERVEALGRGESPTRPAIGVAIAAPHVARGMRRAVGLPDAEGLLVRAVADGSPAGEAGIKEGDLITAVDGRTLTDPDDLSDALASGTSISLELLRGTEPRTVSVKLT